MRPSEENDNPYQHGLHSLSVALTDCGSPSIASTIQQQSVVENTEPVLVSLTERYGYSLKEYLQINVEELLIQQRRSVLYIVKARTAKDLPRSVGR